MNNYKTLYYLNSIGLEPVEFLKSFKYDYLKAGLKACRDYELMYYHCKLLKMPVHTYDRPGLIMAVFHNVLTEYEAMQADRREAIEEARRREDRRQAIYKSIILYWGLLCLVAVLICFYMWLFWR